MGLLAASGILAVATNVVSYGVSVGNEYIWGSHAVIGLYAPVNFYLNNMLWDWYDWHPNDATSPSEAQAAAASPG